MLENLDESQLAYIEMALHQARVQAKANERAQSDSVLRNAKRGPAVITPGMNGGL